MYTPFYKDKNRISNKTDFFFCLQTLLVLWEDLLRWRKEGGHRDGQSSVNKRTFFISREIPLPEG